MEMERVIEFPHADMDRRPRKRPRLGWDVAPQALKEVNEMWAGLGYYRQRMLLSHRSRFLSETDVANHTTLYFTSQSFGSVVNSNSILGSQTFIPAVNFSQHSNQHKQEPSQQMHFSPAYFDSQKLPNFLQQPLGTQFPHASSEGRSFAGRPAHALVTFGFGGKLIVMKDNSSLKNLTYGGQESDGSVINILNLMDVAMDKTDASGTRSGVCDYLYTLCQQSFPSPLVCGNVGSREVNKWIDEKIANCKSPDMDYRKGELLRLFFSLLKIACQFYGKLRSPFGTDHAMKGSKTHMGGTMRLGSRRTYFQVADCLSAKLYGNKSFIDERHRHRYEVNPDMVAQLEDAGLSFTGKDESGQCMEIVGLSSHPFYVGVQFHPEFKSRPGKPLALFLGLIAAACGQLDAVLKKSGTKTTAMSNGTSAIKSHQ